MKRILIGIAVLLTLAIIAFAAVLSWQKPPDIRRATSLEFVFLDAQGWASKLRIRDPAEVRQTLQALHVKAISRHLTCTGRDGRFAIDFAFPDGQVFSASPGTVPNVLWLQHGIGLSGKGTGWVAYELEDSDFMDWLNAKKR